MPTVITDAPCKSRHEEMMTERTNSCEELGEVLYRSLVRSSVEKVKVASTDRRDDNVDVPFPHNLNLIWKQNIHFDPIQNIVRCLI